MGSQKKDTEAKLPPMYSKIILSLENILLPQEKLERSPSVVDGLDADTEYDLRILGCELIQTAGILLKLPQVAMATAQVLFQRFYFCKSFVRHPMDVTAMGCIYLASKIEEAPRRLRDVINVFHHIRQVQSQKEIKPLELDHPYMNIKALVIKAERRLLKELGFCVHVKHPHKLIVCYLQVLMLEKNEDAVQKAWNYMNDSLRTDVFLRHSPETVACACIYLTARKLQLVLPKNPSWFSLLGVNEEEILLVCRKIVNLYKRNINPRELEEKVNQLKAAYEEGRTNNKIQKNNVIVSGNNTPISNKSEHKSPSSPTKIKKIEPSSKRSPRRTNDSSPSRKRDRSSRDSIDSSPRKNRKRDRDRSSRDSFDYSPVRKSPRKKRGHRDRERERDKDRDSRAHHDYRSSKRDRDYKVSTKKEKRRDLRWSPNNSKIRI